MNNENGESLAIQMNSNSSGSRTWLQTLIDSSHLITFCISISVIIYGSFRSLNIDRDNDSYSKQQDSINSKKEKSQELKSTKKKNTKKRVKAKIEISNGECLTWARAVYSELKVK